MPSVRSTNRDTVTEIAILGKGKDFTPALARHLLELGFDERDHDRINELAARNQQGDLRVGEREELDAFANAGCLLGILHAKTRRAFKNAARK